MQKLQYFTSCLHSHNYKIGAKLQKTFELSAHFAPKNIKKHTFLSRFYKKEHSITIKEKILETLVANCDRQFTITEFQNEFEDFSISKYSNQKMSALFTQLLNDNKISKVIDKKKSYFKANV